MPSLANLQETVGSIGLPNALWPLGIPDNESAAKPYNVYFPKAAVLDAIRMSLIPVRGYISTMPLGFSPVQGIWEVTVNLKSTDLVTYYDDARFSGLGWGVRFNYAATGTCHVSAFELCSETSPPPSSLLIETDTLEVVLEMDGLMGTGHANYSYALYGPFPKITINPVTTPMNNSELAGQLLEFIRRRLGEHTIQAAQLPWMDFGSVPPNGLGEALVWAAPNGLVLSTM